MIDQLPLPPVETKHLHVMLVDDEDDYHLITRMMLKKAGFEGRFSAFMEPAEAMAQLRSGLDRPDVLLVDINMPATNGFEFIADCNGNGLIACEDTTVVMCSSSNRPMDMERAFRTVCVQEYIEKPLTIEQFTLIANRHAQRTNHRH